MITRLFDNLIAIMSPEWGVRRACARAALTRLDSVRRSYDAGALSRHTSSWKAKAEAGDSPNLSEVQRTRQRAWDMYRNNLHARKAVRAIVAQTVGVQMTPQSLATGRDGEPLEEIRKQITDLWGLWTPQATACGLSARGGCAWGDFLQQAMRETILSGECLVRFRQLSTREMQRERRVLPFALELIESERLAETAVGIPRGSVRGDVFRGIEFGPRGERVAYWVYDRHPQSVISYAMPEMVRIPASEILHLFVQDRPSQQRGVSWFAPALLQIRDIGDYQENELMAAAAASCIALAIKRDPLGAPPSDVAATILSTPSGEDSTDTDGNTITRLQPAMFFDRLAPGEELTGFDPKRPNVNAEGFILHLLRALATSFPGLKSSQMTGDYRESSFSSERSADNDAWRETDQVQAWVASVLCQPVLEQVIESASFEGVLPRLPRDHADIRRVFATKWQGPVAKSINPADDEEAGVLGLGNGTESLQTLNAKKARDWRQILRDHAEAIEFAKAIGLPETYIEQKLGLMPAIEQKGNADGTKEPSTQDDSEE